MVRATSSAHGHRCSRDASLRHTPRQGPYSANSRTVAKRYSTDFLSPNRTRIGSARTDSNCSVSLQQQSVSVRVAIENQEWAEAMADSVTSQPKSPFIANFLGRSDATVHPPWPALAQAPSPAPLPAPRNAARFISFSRLLLDYVLRVLTDFL
ncbi:unnamed protein product [Leptosia nina]|uniref:Uncharacterized protein n=1 Tax=Leptosia nina TaxID=320188 RepID=A0AAV1JRR6_9NEOP